MRYAQRRALRSAQKGENASLKIFFPAPSSANGISLNDVARQVHAARSATVRYRGVDRMILKLVIARVATQKPPAAGRSCILLHPGASACILAHPIKSFEQAKPTLPIS